MVYNKCGDDCRYSRKHMKANGEDWPMKYVTPELELIRFDAKDVILISVEGPAQWEVQGLPLGGL